MVFICGAANRSGIGKLFLLLLLMMMMMMLLLLLMMMMFVFVVVFVVVVGGGDLGVGIWGTVSHRNLWLLRVCISEVTSRLTTLCTTLHTVSSIPSLYAS